MLCSTKSTLHCTLAAKKIITGCSKLKKNQLDFCVLYCVLFCNTQCNCVHTMTLRFIPLRMVFGGKCLIIMIELIDYCNPRHFFGVVQYFLGTCNATLETANQNSNFPQYVYLYILRHMSLFSNICRDLFY